jgi:hypothetical protein
MGNPGRREFIQVLRLMENFHQHQVEQAVGEALRLGAISFDAVKMLLRFRNFSAAALSRLRRSRKHGRPIIKSMSETGRRGKPPGLRLACTSRHRNDRDAAPSLPISDTPIPTHIWEGLRVHPLIAYPSLRKGGLRPWISRRFSSLL